ncbi:hypothetical protein BDV93DRAFT_525830 [Ceratobasidium sp. AG-I]|nr:hypothetical protein BDV93DRAFT_525830 [Ceratobasidium sp. AG-I]
MKYCSSPPTGFTSLWGTQRPITLNRAFMCLECMSIVLLYTITALNCYTHGFWGGITQEPNSPLLVATQLWTLVAWDLNRTTPTANQGPAADIVLPEFVHHGLYIFYRGWCYFSWILSIYVFLASAANPRPDASTNVQHPSPSWLLIAVAMLESLVVVILATLHRIVFKRSRRNA